MHDQPLTEADQKEALSRAYVAAVAARAGYTTTTTNPDRDGIDLRIQASGRFRPALDVQLKRRPDLDLHKMVCIAMI